MDTVKNYFTQSGFGIAKSTFGAMGIYDEEEVEQYVAMSNLFLSIIIIAGVILGFIAVSHICTDTSERGKNVRLGLYILLILTGGQFGWLFALLWLFKINICS